MPKIKKILQKRAKKADRWSPFTSVLERSFSKQLDEYDDGRRIFHIDSPMNTDSIHLVIPPGKHKLSRILGEIASARLEYPEARRLLLIRSQSDADAINSPYYQRELRRYYNKHIYPDLNRPEIRKRTKVKEIKLKSPYIGED